MSHSLHQLGNRIVVVGSSGSGKSSFANQLSKKLGIPHLELDSMHWLSEWTPEEPQRFRGLVEKAASRNSWVFDGNYRIVRDLIWPRCNSIIWLDYSLTTCLNRLVIRSLKRASTGELLWGTNRESLRQNFFSKDSVILWLLRTHSNNRKTISEDTMNADFFNDGAPANLIRLESPKKADIFLADLNFPHANCL